MLTSLISKNSRSRSVSEYDLNYSNKPVGQKSHFRFFSRKTSNSFPRPQHIHSEPTRRKFNPSLHMDRRQNSSKRDICSYGSTTNVDLNLSSSNSNHRNSDDNIPRANIDSLGTERRLAICSELEKNTLMKNGESLLICHKNLVIRDVLESYAFI